MHEPVGSRTNETKLHTLNTRIVILEAALASIDRECERALERPEVLFMTMCRVAALTRQSLLTAARPRHSAD